MQNSKGKNELGFTKRVKRKQR